MMLAGDARMREMIDAMFETQVDTPAMINPEAFVKVFKTALWFMTIVSSLLLVHLVLSFRILKRYRHLFSREQPLS
jgi:hypothetical protein